MPMFAQLEIDEIQFVVNEQVAYELDDVVVETEKIDEFDTIVDDDDEREQLQNIVVIVVVQI